MRGMREHVDDPRTGQPPSTLMDQDRRIPCQRCREVQELRRAVRHGRLFQATEDIRRSAVVEGMHVHHPLLVVTLRK